MTGEIRPAPLLAVTLGDPSGIGPEIIVKAWRALRDGPTPFLVIGDCDVLAGAAGDAGEVRKVSDPQAARRLFPEAMPVLHQRAPAAVVPGRPTPQNAAAITGWIETAVAMALAGDVGGVVTAPIAKAPLYEAGFRFPGHTEFLAALTASVEPSGPRGPVMLLTARDLRVALVTIHLPLAKAVADLTADLVVRTGRVLDHALRTDFGVRAPRIAMAALNPHAGEGGALGREEIEILNPAAVRLREAGVDCSDARPADTLFHDEARKAFDAVICQYHDQALIPLKTLDFWSGVNISIGLPIVRASPDHGTGFDIAGRGLARADSLIAAIRVAADMAARRAGASPP